jgi:hypothetical protein
MLDAISDLMQSLEGVRAMEVDITTGLGEFLVAVAKVDDDPAQNFPSIDLEGEVHINRRVLREFVHLQLQLETCKRSTQDNASSEPTTGGGGGGGGGSGGGGGRFVHSGPDFEIDVSSHIMGMLASALGGALTMTGSDGNRTT